MITIVEYRLPETNCVTGAVIGKYDNHNDAVIPNIGDVIPLKEGLSTGTAKVINIEDRVVVLPPGTAEQRLVTLTLER